MAKSQPDLNQAISEENGDHANMTAEPIKKNKNNQPQEVKKSKNPFKRFKESKRFRRVVFIVLSSLIFSTVYVLAAIYQDIQRQNAIPAVNNTQTTQSNQNTSQQNNFGDYYYQQDPELIILENGSDYSPSQLISLTSLEEPAIYLSNRAFTGKVTVKLYRASESDVLNSLVYETEDYKTKNPFNESNSQLVKELEVNIADKNSSDTKVVLPLDESGIYFVRATASDTANKTNDGAFIVRSTYAVVSKEGNNEIVYWGQNLKVNESIDDGNIKVFNLADKVTEVANGRFNSEGIATTPILSRGDLAVVYRGNEVAVIPLNLQYVDYGYNYDYFREKEINTRFFIFTDRPLYMPGNTVNFKAIIRSDDDARYTIPSGEALVQIKDGWEDTSVVYSARMNITPEGTIYGSYKLPENAKTGDYSVSIEYPIVQHDPDDYYYPASEYFQVEYYRKPEYNIDLSVEDKDYVSGDRLYFKALGNYFSGQPITEGKVSYRIYSADYYDYYYYRDYQNEGLSDDYRYGYWYGSEFKHGELEFNDNGEAIFDEDINLGDTYKSNQILTIEAEYDNGSGNPSFARKNILFYKGESNVYLQEDAPYGGVVNKQFEIPMQIVAYRNNSKVSNINVEISGTWMRYEAVYEENQKYPSYKEVRGEIDTKNIKTDGEGNLTYKFTPSETGSYTITIKYSDSIGNKISRNFSFYIAEKEYSSYYGFGDYGQSNMRVSVDKKLYNPEDTAKVLITTEDKSNRDALITLERGRTQRYFTTRIENGTANIDVPLVNTDSPNVFVVATSFDGKSIISSSENIVISTENKKINVQITPRGGSRYGPGEDITVDVTTTDSTNKPVSTDMALWTVDKAIFELVDQNNYDILDRFWSERYNDTNSTNSLQGISSSGAESGGGCFVGDTKVLTKNGLVSIEDIKVGDKVLTKAGEDDTKLVEATVTETFKKSVNGYMILNGSIKVTPNHVMWINNTWQEAGTVQKGDLLLSDEGKYVHVNSIEIINRSVDVYNLEVEKYHTYFAGGVWVHNQKGDTRTVFKDTAYWNPSLRTDLEGKASVSFKLPDNLTTWVIAGIAANTTTQVGIAKEEIVVGKNVIVRPTIPNIIRERDTTILTALVQNYTKNADTFNVTLRSEAANILPSATQEVRIEPNKSATVSWNVEPIKVDDKAKFTYSAVSKSAEENSDTIAQVIPIKKFGFYEERVESKQDNASYQAKYSSDAVNDLSSTKLSVSADILGSLRPAMDYLVDYPYGCMEQTTSRFVPAIVARSNPKVFASAMVDKNMDEILKDGVKRIEDHQQGDGGWTWVFVGDSNEYLSAYIVENLMKAKQLGYEVNQTTLDNAENYFKSKLNSENKSAKVYSIYGLEVLGKNTETINDFEGLSIEANALAVIINSNRGIKDSNQSGLTKLVSSAKRQSGLAHWESNNSETFSTNQSATALAVRAIIANGSEKELLKETIKYLNQAKGNYFWGNTHGTAQVMASISEYAKVQNLANTNYSYTVSLDGAILSTGRFTSLEQAPKEITIPSYSIKAGGSNLEITKDGTGELLTSMMVKEFHTDPNTKAMSTGLDVKRAYVSEKGAGKSIAVGDLVDVYVQVKNNYESESRYGVIQDELPAGLVPVNESFNNEQFSSGDSYDYYSGDEYTQNGAIRYTYSYRSGYSYLNYKARAITEGTYEVPPATASLMYSPEIHGRSDAAKISITKESTDLADANALGDQSLRNDYRNFATYAYPYLIEDDANLIESGKVAVARTPKWQIVLYGIATIAIIVFLVKVIRKPRRDLSKKNEPQT